MIIKRYQAIFSKDLSQDLIDEIQQASTFSMPLGNNKFKQQIEEALKQKIGEIKLGRPKNEKQIMRIVLVCHRPRSLLKKCHLPNCLSSIPN